ncbi:MAG: carbohydrate kinase [Gammaproteobacteria bacterium]|nr:carbohydrate kinase [Gammaproteobacteria bacterium]
MMRSKVRPIIFGEVLFDCFPDGSRVPGGAPFNVAWHCQAFGLSPLFISRVGNDPLGLDIKKIMLDWGMDTSGLQLDSAHPTGIVDVTFNNDEPSYDIVENSAWDFIDSDALPPDTSCSLLYHGSLALRNTVSASTLSTLKKSCPDASFIDINLRSPWWNFEQVNNLISQGQWIKLNQEELALIVPSQNNMKDRVNYLLSNTPMKLLIVTCGDKGALAFPSSGEEYYIQPETATSVVDTVGAGDAFTSVLLLGNIKDWTLEETLQRAQSFASAIVGNRGATVQNMDFYQPFIHNWNL